MAVVYSRRDYVAVAPFFFEKSCFFFLLVRWALSLVFYFSNRQVNLWINMMIPRVVNHCR
ncbi:hypothetical protein BO70DRAFT_113697 [Aspergillus heteromorphus CBS 117.55]|uniref:Uncharacterized protein n=1 Tax=Aspergillus heteromorphus CBS 117.55 TaxID=1448321 RepID=A0A317VGC4_9EURO|nr:uncharacterized protein BO70DRAFT_113697 [Aspergillus heteromorphus CBS 117.55]PWY72965.1 hypothetical protein BO70DRAFT_113697 [Aspergillus heteromorphus CBS 117.55]